MTANPQLAERLIDLADRSDLDPVVLLPLLKRLAAGEPINIADLAADVDLDVAALRARLAAAPDTEFDEDGHIIGLGLTLRPTPHRLTLAGQELYTWCAFDTLVFPALLGQTARVESTAPDGTVIRMTVTPDAVTRIEPASAVMSVLPPAGDAPIRTGFCNQVHFFTAPEDAAEWLADHPEAQVIPVAEAHRLATELATNIASLAARCEASPATDSCDAPRGGNSCCC